MLSLPLREARERRTPQQTRSTAWGTRACTARPPPLHTRPPFFTGKRLKLVMRSRWEWKMRREDSYINTSPMSVLLSSARRGVQRLEPCAGGRGVSDMRSRCRLDFVEPGSWRWGRGRGSPPGAMAHAGPLPYSTLAGLVQTLPPRPASPSPPDLIYLPRFPALQEARDGVACACLASRQFRNGNL